MVASPSSKKPRARNALVLAVLVLASLEAALGMASAADGASSTAESMPAKFGVPAPRVGDRLIYSVTTVDASRDPPEPVAGELPLFQFEWVGARDLWDEEEQPAATGIGQILWFVDDPEAFDWMHERAQLYIAPDGELSAYERESVDDESASGGALWVQRALIFADFPQFDENPAPCGLRSPMQAREISTTKAFAILGRCQLPGVHLGSWAGAPLLFTAVDSAWQSGVLAVLFEARDGENQTIQAWFSSSSPYPLQITVKTSDDSNLLQVARFHVEARGETPLPAAAAPNATVPILELVPVTPWGVDDAGVEHPFPVSAAFAAARDDPDDSRFREFLAGPNAFLASASESTWVRQQGPMVVRSYTWFLILADGSAKYAACVTLEERSPVAALGAPPVSQLSVEACETGTGNVPSIEAQPEALPSWRSVLEARLALSRTAFEGTVPLLHYSVHCTKSCQESHLSFYAGMGTDFSGDGGVPIATSAWDNEESVVYVSQTGRISSLTERKHHWDIEWAKPLLPPERETVESAPLEEIVAPHFMAFQLLGVTWAAPEPAATGFAAAIAAIAALAYWMWPYAKASGLFGLFSRVQRPRALEHPSRSTLFEAIQRSPGIHFQELCRVAGIGHGAVQHHLDQLMAVGVITRTESAGYHCYFPAGAADRRWMENAHLLKSDVAIRILQHIAATPTANGVDIAKRAGVTTSAVSYHLRRFRNAGLIESVRTGGRLTITLTPAGTAAIQGAAQGAAVTA